MRRAARLDDNQVDIAAALRDAGCDVQSLAAVGCGVPDLLVWHPATGYHIVEIKNPEQVPSKRELTRAQRKFHAFWRGPIAVVETPAEALAAVGVDAGCVRPAAQPLADSTSRSTGRLERNEGPPK